MTAFGGARDWTLLSGLGADAFLVKPFDLDAFMTNVRKLLGSENVAAAAGG